MSFNGFENENINFYLPILEDLEDRGGREDQEDQIHLVHLN
jgi:hypothetical protein